MWDIFCTTNFTPWNYDQTCSDGAAAISKDPTSCSFAHWRSRGPGPRCLNHWTIVDIQERSKIKAVSYILFSRSWGVLTTLAWQFIEWFHFRLKITGGGDLETWISPEMRENQDKARTFFYFKHAFSYFLLVWYKWIQHSGRTSAWKNEGTKP